MGVCKIKHIHIDIIWASVKESRIYISLYIYMYMGVCKRKHIHAYFLWESVKESIYTHVHLYGSLFKKAYKHVHLYSTESYKKAE